MVLQTPWRAGEAEEGEAAETGLDTSGSSTEEKLGATHAADCQRGGPCCKL